MKSLQRFYGSLFFLLLMVVACEPDPCEGLNCGNGVCDTVSGDCLCSRGWQLDASNICTIQWTAKLVGSYSVTDSCTGNNPGTSHYTSTIAASSEKEFTIDNFKSAHTINLTHNSSTTFSINDTLINNRQLTGSGTFQDSTFVLDYIYGDTLSGLLDTCQAVFN